MRFDISTFGAVAEAECTGAIQATIDACARADGGEVVVPNGRFFTGTLRLKTGVTLHLSEGAVLVASPNPSRYPADVHRSMYSGESNQDRCLIFAREAQNVAITGPGAIDGNAAAFPDVNDGQQQRPMLMRLIDCQGILLRDVKLRNASATGLTILYSSDICIDNLRLENRPAAEGDGLALDGCRDVRVSNCLVNAGRDALCVQCSRTDRPSSNIVIGNCVLSGKSSAIRVGLLSVGMIRELAMNNCVMHDIDEAAIKVQVNEGGVAENLRFSNLVMREVLRAVLVSLNRHRACAATPAGIPPMGALRAVSFAGIQMQTCRASDRRAAVIITGSRDGKIEDVSITDADITVAGGGEKYEGRLADIRELGASRPEPRALGSALPAYGLFARHVAGLHLEKVRFHTDLPDAREAQVLDDVT